MPTRHRLAVCAAAMIAGTLLLPTVSPRGATMKFYPDDPIQREPETQDASKAEEWDIDLFCDLAENLFGKPGD